MKQIFDWLREQITKCLEYNKTCENEFQDSNMTFIYKGQINTWKMALAMVDEAEAKWEADCCEWWFDRTEKFWRCSCEEGQDYEVDAPNDNGYNFCPYCGRKISEV